MLFHNTCKASSEGVNKSTCGLLCEGNGLKRSSILFKKQGSGGVYCNSNRFVSNTDGDEVPGTPELTSVMEVEGRLLHHLIQKHALERPTKISAKEFICSAPEEAFLRTSRWWSSKFSSFAYCPCFHFSSSAR